MTNINIDFTWFFDPKGYRRCKNGRLVGTSGQLQTYRPLEKIPTLFKIFSDKCRTEKGVIDFVSRVHSTQAPAT